jgi:hypothetical protein
MLRSDLVACLLS